MRYLTVITTLFCLMHYGNAQVTTRQDHERDRGDRGGGESYFRQESPRNFQLMYVTGAFEGKEYSNTIISQMGKLAGINPVNNFKAIFNYVENLTIDKVDDQMNLRFSLKSVGFSNLRDVYGFDMSALLVPDRMSFKLQLLNEQGNVVYEKIYADFDVSFLDKNRPYREIVNISVEDEIRRPGGTLRITEVLMPIAHLKFYHSAGKSEQFKGVAALIQAYRSDAATMAEIITITERYDPDDLDHLKSFLDELEASKAIYDRIVDDGYEKKLDLRLKDPEKLLPMLASFPTLYHEKRTDLQRILRTFDDALYHKGMSYFDRRDYRMATQWFLKTIDFNPLYAPAHYRMAWIAYKDGKMDDARRRAYSILSSDMVMDTRLSMEVSALLDEIHTRKTSAWLDQASSMISRGDYQRAEQLVDKVQDYYHQYPLSPYSKAFTDLLYGYQLSLLGSGETMLQRKQYTMAYELLQQCLLVSQKYGLNVPYDVEKMLEQAGTGIFSDLLIAGQRAMNMKDFDGAEYYLREATSFFGQGWSPMAQTALESYRQTLLESMITEGRRLIQIKDFSGAIAMFERAQNALYVHGIRSYLHIPSLIIEAREGYVFMRIEEVLTLAKGKSFRDAIGVLKEVVDYMTDYALSGVSSVKFSEASSELLNRILQQVDVLNRNKEYTVALGLVKDAWYVCQNFPSSCSERMVIDREAEARRGEYTLMIEDARKDLNDGNLTQAKNHLAKAGAYRNRHPDLVGSNADEDLLFGKIRGKEYQKAIAAGKMHLNRKEYQQALPFFDEAAKLETEGGFNSDRKLDEYRRSAAIAVILDETDQLSRILSEGGLMATKDKLLRLIALRFRYNLNDHKEINDRLGDLQIRMMSAACLKQQEQYDRQMNEAYQYVLNKNFLEASTEIGQAIKTAAKLPECNISDSSATRYQVQLTPAIRYQEKMTEALQFLRNNKNAEAVEAYAAAGDLFIRGNVAVYGLEHLGLGIFALQQDQGFILAAAFHFRACDNMLATMKMLKELAFKSYPASQTRLLQEQVGFFLGKEDRVQNPASDWKTAVTKHTGGNKFFKYFKKAYSKGWKKG